VIRADKNDMLMLVRWRLRAPGACPGNPSKDDWGQDDVAVIEEVQSNLFISISSGTAFVCL
jgi:hypothetical protein